LGPFKAILFDLDGLLADTEHLHVLAYDRVARRLGIKLNREYINAFIGIATRENIIKIMNDFQIPEKRFDEILELRYESYHNIVKETPLFPMEGAVECVQKAEKTNLKRGLVTSSLREHALSVLENISRNYGENNHINMVEFFDVMVFGSDVVRLKPEPDIYVEATRRLKLAPESCIAIEDSEAGVISAKKAGLTVIAVPNVHTRRQEFYMADYILNSLHEVLDLSFFN
jgi:HAD superfamily hydrolase (TIGR01509 family)